MPQKHFLRRPLRFFRAPVYLENDVSVVHRVFRFSVPLLVDSSGRGGLISAEVKRTSADCIKSPEPRTHKSRGFRFLRTTN